MGGTHQFDVVEEDARLFGEKSMQSSEGPINRVHALRVVVARAGSLGNTADVPLDAPSEVCRERVR